MKNLPSPWENCTSHRLDRFWSYSRAACQEECLANHIMKKCHCQELYMNDSSARFCSPKELATCVEPTRHIYPRVKNTTCSCPDPCEDRIYETSISQSTLSNSFFLDLAAKHGKTEQYWRDNAAILQVYYPDLIEENVVHQKSFSVMTLFCNIGGVFGLVLGAGFISVVEVFDFCFTKILSGCKKRKSC